MLEYEQACKAEARCTSRSHGVLIFRGFECCFMLFQESKARGRSLTPPIRRRPEACFAYILLPISYTFQTHKPNNNSRLDDQHQRLDWNGVRYKSKWYQFLDIFGYIHDFILRTFFQPPLNRPRGRFVRLLERSCRVHCLAGGKIWRPENREQADTKEQKKRSGHRNILEKICLNMLKNV